jgi:carboxylesterase type B
MVAASSMLSNGVLASSGCAPRSAAKIRTDSGIPAWVYRCYGDFPNNRIGPGAGAYHGSDLPVLFGTSEYAHKESNTTEEEVLTKKWQEVTAPNNPRKLW